MRNDSTLHPIALIVCGLLALAWAQQCLAAEAEDEAGQATLPVIQTISGTVEAGSTANQFQIEVVNSQRDIPVDNVSVNVDGELRHISNVRVSPSRIARLEPGQSQEFTVTFDIPETSPDQATDSVSFIIEADTEHLEDEEDQVFFDTDVVVLEVTIVKPVEETPPVAASSEPEDTEALPKYAFLIINVAGSGYIPHWAGASWFASGSNDEIFGVKRDENPIPLLEAYRERLIGDPCKKDIPAIPGLSKRPGFWSSGPQITILDVEPYDNYYTAQTYDFQSNWTKTHKDGIHIGIIKKAAGCG